MRHPSDRSQPRHSNRGRDRDDDRSPRGDRPYVDGAVRHDPYDSGSGRFGAGRYASSPYGYGTGPDGMAPRNDGRYGSGPYGGSRYGLERYGVGHDGGGDPATGQHVGKGPKNFTRSDDRIREQVCELLEDADIDASGVEVTVQDGEVTLEGTVTHRADKRHAEDIVCHARGVKECHNRLRVQREVAHASSNNGVADEGRAASTSSRNGEAQGRS